MKTIMQHLARINVPTTPLGAKIAAEITKAALPVVKANKGVPALLRVLRNAEFSLSLDERSYRALNQCMFALARLNSRLRREAASQEAFSLAVRAHFKETKHA